MTPYVLVVEDEDALATLLHYNLDKEGYQIAVAGDGEEALTMASERAVLRRIRPGLADDRITVGDIVIDRVAHRVKRQGKEVHLGPTEFRLLDYLMQHPGRVFSREQLLDAVWGSDVYVEARTVDVHIGRLRKALNGSADGDPIRTVRSAGYSLDVEAA
ncbi:MAG: hypothetical protein B7Y81_11465 [Caulobacter sp. 32-67-35]|nr:MAG: hypothetical protein B7Y81_11465 [Caulobacter sp. 32-67-35]